MGRFLQTDPIGYEDQYNLYAYVGNDPVNLIDPTGKSTAGNVAKRTCTTSPQGLVVCTTVAMVAVFLTQVILSEPTTKPRFETQLPPPPQRPQVVNRDGPFDVSPSGKVRDRDLNIPIGNTEIDDAIGQLNDSIEQREKEQREAPRGYPGESDASKKNRAKRRKD